MLFLGQGFIVTFALSKGAFYQNSIVVASIKKKLKIKYKIKFKNQKLSKIKF